MVLLPSGSSTHFSSSSLLHCPYHVEAVLFFPESEDGHSLPGPLHSIQEEGKGQSRRPLPANPPSPVSFPGNLSRDFHFHMLTRAWHTAPLAEGIQKLCPFSKLGMVSPEIKERFCWYGKREKNNNLIINWQMSFKVFPPPLPKYYDPLIHENRLAKVRKNQECLRHNDPTTDVWIVYIISASFHMAL